MKILRMSAVLAALTFVGSSLVTFRPASATDNLAADGINPSTGPTRPGDAIPRGRAILSEMIGIPEHEVDQMIARQRELASFRASVAGDPSFGGLWIDAADPTLVTIASVGSGAASDTLKRIPLTGPVTVRSVPAQLSLSYLLARRDDLARALRSLGIPFGVGVDEPANGLELLVDPQNQTVAEDQIKALGLTSFTSVALGDAKAKSTVTYGGMGLTVSGYNCTAGFAVTNGSSDGILTAGHCRNGSPTSNGDTLNTEVAEGFGGDQDRQIHPAPSGADAWAFMGSGWSPVYGQEGSWVVGGYACTYGITTNQQTCGTAGSVTWSSTSGGYVGSGNTYVSEVTLTNQIRFSPSMWCQPGDSGGPVMNGYSALATMTSEQWGWCLVMPIWNQLAGSGYWLKTQ